MTTPSLTVQTASLYASGFYSQFAGSGGPYGYDIFSAQFGGVVSSALLAADPFDDQLWNVDAGDTVTFVIAVQNLSGAPAYNLLLRDTMPAGFRAPGGDPSLSVTDGAGNVLATSGNLFAATGGLRLTSPVAAYDADSGANVVLLTFSLVSADTIAVPKARLTNTATLVSFAATPGGPNLAGAGLAASTPVTTAEPTLASTPRQDPATLLYAQRASFDVALTLPEGLTRNLSIAELLPRTDSAWFSLVSTEIIHVGRNLTVTSPATPLADGTLNLGDVQNTPDDITDYDDQVVLRLTVTPIGTGSGTGTLVTRVTSTDPNGSGVAYATSITNSLQVSAVDQAPTIAGTRGAQSATTSMPVHPLAQMLLADVDENRAETLTVQLSDRTLGSLGGATIGSYDPASGLFTAQGTVAQLQAAAQALVFTASGRTGTEGFRVTLDDGNGGSATDSTAALRLSAPAVGSDGIQHFALSPTATVYTSTATGDRTVTQIETYGGPVSYLQSQFVYDGTETVAIAAQTPNVFIKCVAGSVAVQLLSGQNVVDAGHGSNFLIGGTGTDTFFLDTRQTGVTWDTIGNFHQGDMVTIWAYQPGVSTYRWEDNAGADGWKGRTLRLDVTGSGHTEESITFAGTTAADTSHYAITTGTVGGLNYMQVTGL